MDLRLPIVFVFFICLPFVLGQIGISPVNALVQDATFIMSFALLVIELTWMRLAAKGAWWRALYGIGILTIAIHTIGYYVVVFIFRVYDINNFSEGQLLSDWSTILRFHGMGIFLIGEGFRLWDLILVRKAQKKAQMEVQEGVHEHQSN